MSFDTQHQSTQPDGAVPPPGIGAPAPLTPSESLAEFLAFRKQFDETLRPRDIVEQTMVYQLASAAWRLRRLPFLESVLTAALFHRAAAWKELDLLSRHETRLNRAFAQTLREIEARHKASPPKPQRAATARSAAPYGENKSASAPGFNYRASGPSPNSPPAVHVAGPQAASSPPS
jgi:hypothetical protein